MKTSHRRHEWGEKGVEKCVKQFDKELNPFICPNKTRQQETVCLGLYEGRFYSDLNATAYYKARRGCICTRSQSFEPPLHTHSELHKA